MNFKLKIEIPCTEFDEKTNRISYTIRISLTTFTFYCVCVFNRTTYTQKFTILSLSTSQTTNYPEILKMPINFNIV